MSKTTTGPNDRPKTTTIAQTGAGLPDDSAGPVAVDDAEVERVKAKLTGGGGAHEQMERDVRQEIEGPLKGSA